MKKKKIKKVIKLQIPAGRANPAPPIGPALGQAGVNIMEFCRQFNAQTENQLGMVIPTVITVYEDRKFEFELKTPPASALLKKAVNLEKGASKVPPYVATVTIEKITQIAKMKMKDLNTTDLSKAINQIRGTAKSMGIEVIG